MKLHRPVGLVWIVSCLTVLLSGVVVLGDGSPAAADEAEFIVASKCSSQESKLDWWGGSDNTFSYFYLNQPRGEVYFCWTLTKKGDVDPGADYYVMRAVSYWSHTYGSAGESAWMYQDIQSNTAAIDHVYYATDSVSSTSSCTHPIELSVGYGPLEVSTELQMCSSYGINQYSYSDHNAGWYSNRVGGLRRVETVFSQKVGQGVRPTFDVTFWSPQYSSDCGGTYCRVSTHLVSTTWEVTPSAQYTLVWNSSYSGAAIGGGGGGGTPSVPRSIDVKRNEYIDGDGYPSDAVSDLVGVRISDGCLYAWMGNGNGGLDHVADHVVGCGWGNYTELTALGDITGNGVGDLVAVRKSDGRLFRWRGVGNASFAAVDDGGGWLGWDNYRDLTGVGDVTGDGIGDLVAVRKETGKLHLWSGESKEGSEFFGLYHVDELDGDWGKFEELAGVGDITGDGVGDLVAVNSDGILHRWKGTTTGSFEALGTWGGNWERYTQLAGMGDLNRDGIGDLVAVHKETGYLYRWMGNGNGGFHIGTDYGPGWLNYTNLA